MKKQVTRLSPHQNAKVLAILTALGSLLFIVPMSILMFVVESNQPGMKDSGPPVFFFLLFPFLYLIFGYVSVIAACAIYNYLYKYIGGIEFEEKDEGTQVNAGPGNAFPPIETESAGCQGGNPPVPPVKVSEQQEQEPDH